uniref:Olfactory receptor n=1 Tax=Xenopus tropicalis TaxID=8364 RepID=A0A803KE25_XENTR
MTNGTNDDIFILLGFNHLLQVRPILIGIFSILYIFTLLGNSLIIVLILKDKRLHTPMYFFLANLSMLDLLSPSATVPKMIADLASGEGKISVHKCFTQLFFIITFVATESPLLSIMAFDRYVAICNPLYYGSIINFKLCAKLTSGAWILGSLYSLLHTLLTNNIDFCGSNINHFFCDFLPLFQLACSDITPNLIIVYVSDFLNGMCNFLIILSSYISIITTILRITSQKGRLKAFSTCASHLTVIFLYYGTLISTYFHPLRSFLESKDRTASLIYTMVTPALNPLIYSLRNNDVKKALKIYFAKV